MELWAIILLALGIGAAIWIGISHVVMRRRMRDLAAFHIWAVESVRRARHGGGSVPNQVVNYLVMPADKAWAAAVGYSEGGAELKAIEAAESLDIPPLLRFQISLSQDEGDWFISQYGDLQVPQ